MISKKVEKQLKVGDHVVYFDEYGRPQQALVTNVWGDRYVNVDDDCKEGPIQEPGCNLLFISPYKHREDSFGRQIERRSSVCHTDVQCAYGNSYCLPDQLDESLAKIDEAKKKLYADVTETDD